MPSTSQNTREINLAFGGSAVFGVDYRVFPMLQDDYTAEDYITPNGRLVLPEGQRKLTIPAGSSTGSITVRLMVLDDGTNPAEDDNIVFSVDKVVELTTEEREVPDNSQYVDRQGNPIDMAHYNAVKPYIGGQGHLLDGDYNPVLKGTQRIDLEVALTPGGHVISANHPPTVFYLPTLNTHVAGTHGIREIWDYLRHFSIAQMTVLYKIASDGIVPGSKTITTTVRTVTDSTPTTTGGSRTVDIVETPTFTTSDANGAEAGSVTFTVNLTPPLPAEADPATFYYSVYSRDGDKAMANVHYVDHPNGTLTFAPGDTSRDIVVYPIDNGEQNDDRTFTLTLLGSSEGTAVSNEYEYVTGTITDDDALMGIELSLSPEKVAESGGAQKVMVTASIKDGVTFGTDKTVQVVIGATDDSATDDEDYMVDPDLVESITIPAGQSSGSSTFTITPVDDGQDDPDETITVSARLPGTDASSPPDASATLTIVEASTFSIGDASAAEGGEMTFTVNLNPALTAAASVDYATSSSSAKEGEDYTAATGTLSFEAGETSKTFTVATLDDIIDDDGESFTVTLSSPMGGAVIGGATATGTIMDDDARPTGFALSLTPGSISEGGGTQEITATVEVLGGTTFTTDLTFGVTVSDEHRAGVPYVHYDPKHPYTLPKEITIPAGESSGSTTFSVTPTDDLVDAIHEDVIVVTASLQNSLPGTGPGQSRSALLTITDDDQPYLSLGTPVTVSEDYSGTGASSSTFTWPVSVTDELGMHITSQHTLTSGYELEGDTATAGEDYQDGTGIIEIAPGQQGSFISVVIINDSEVEENETFIIRLINPGPGLELFEGESEMVITITDDDASPSGQPQTSSAPVEPVEPPQRQQAAAWSLSVTPDLPLNRPAEPGQQVEATLRFTAGCPANDCSGAWVELDPGWVNPAEDQAVKGRNADFGSVNFWPADKAIDGRNCRAQGGIPADGSEAIGINVRYGDGAPRYIRFTLENQGGMLAEDRVWIGDEPEPAVQQPPTNNAPSFADGNGAVRDVAENSAGGTNVGAPVTATDPDGHTLTYALSGADAGSFDIDAATGQLLTRQGGSYDYEAQASYSLTVEASDGNGGTAGIAVAVSLTDVDEAPFFSEGSYTARGMAENPEASHLVGAPVAATDPEGNSLTYTLSGTDAASFEIDSDTGQLRTVAGVTYDYEVQVSYALTVTAWDGNGVSASIDVTVTLTDVDETPTEPIAVTACFTDLGSLTVGADYTGTWDDADCRAHHQDGPARYFRFTLSEETTVAVSLSAGALYLSKDTPQNGWGAPPNGTYDHRVSVRRENGKLVHDSSNTATLTLDAGEYTAEAAGSGGGEFTISIAPQ